MIVCSFYVNRREDYPEAVDYVPLLKVLDASCRRLGMSHVVLTDVQTTAELYHGGLRSYSASLLPRSLMRALTEAQAYWLEIAPFEQDILFVGADCLIRRDFRGRLPPADLSIILRPGHKRHRINNGFMFVPAASRAKVAPLFRRIADTCGEAMCDDMVAVEQALAPMPMDYGIQERAGLTVNFVPMMPWQGVPDAVEDPIEDAFVLHFRGQRRKQLMLDWAKRHLR